MNIRRITLEEYSVSMENSHCILSDSKQYVYCFPIKIVNKIMYEHT